MPCPLGDLTTGATEQLTTGMNPLAQLTFRGAKRVRVFGTHEKPLFVAADVCQILGIVDAHQAVASLDDDERGTCTVPTPGGEQAVSVVSESGLYSLIFKSRKPEAKAFKRWVTSDVLPAIRLHGKYEIEEQAKRLAFDKFLLEVPTDWRRTFSDGWFSAILGVWGVDYIKARTPGFVGKVINEFVYEALIAGLPEELKARRAECGKDCAKLHQFLVTEAREKLSEHLAVTKALALNCQGQPHEFREAFDRVFRGRNQLMLTLNARRPAKRRIAA